MGFPAAAWCVNGTPLWFEGVEFMNDRGRVAVIFRHDAAFDVAGVKYRDADHQRGGEVQTVGVSGSDGLNTVQAPVLEAGTIPASKTGA